MPWEERIEESYERKLEKYQPLVDTSKERGWGYWCFPEEVGRDHYGEPLVAFV
jgi:hypothetical protein